MALRHHNVRWTEAAVDDLVGIGEHIARDSEQAALAVADRLQECATSLCTLAGRGRLVPELEERGVQRYRERILSPWRIVYHVTREAVFIDAVLDARRGPDQFPFERLLTQSE